ncbi:MAG: hypothetical protein EAZ57_01470 [Cytophagales bacterium]|nr:MAG: hypothetical protein EAZ67_01805 [Cytophagales bacterium]TAF62120.1 MAG: hypothetical protein EAZ57_01470 [Cytophagales bacterium]
MKKFAFILFICLWAATVSMAQKTMPLTYNLPVGHSFTLTQVSKMGVMQNISGMELETLQTTEGTNTLKVVESNNDAIKFEVAHTSFKRSIQTMHMNQTTDAANPQDAHSKFLAALLGKTFFMSIDKYGKIMSTEGLEKAVEAAKVSMGDLSPADAAAAEQTAVAMGNAEIFTKNMQAVFLIYSKDKVGKNSEWSYVTESAEPLSLAQQHNIKVLKLGKKGGVFTAYIDMSPTTTSDYVLGTGNLEVKNEVAGKNICSIITQKNGLLSSMTSNANLSGTISIKANAQIPQDMVIPCSYTISNTFSVK